MQSGETTWPWPQRTLQMLTAAPTLVFSLFVIGGKEIIAVCIHEAG